jgi:hypothetical protein
MPSVWVMLEIVYVSAPVSHLAGFHCGSGVCRIGSIPPKVTASVT